MEGRKEEKRRHRMERDEGCREREAREMQKRTRMDKGGGWQQWNRT